jgi:hypothetical protein
MMLILRPSPSSMITAIAVTSLPVPAVVGTAIMGMSRRSITL